MTQETRKDPRAKVLTMTVRYKSATLDEFIEHHSHDVSRGGMFIKTPSPFPPGTLLKFEVKISGEQRVMQGVGRVVWKRESAEVSDARPAGMGVKFIKIDDESRRVIDQLVAARGSAASAFDQGADGPGARSPSSQVVAPPLSGTRDASASSKQRKATMIGLGAMQSEPESAETAAAEAFFPPAPTSADMPAPEDRTVMKQAAELLQDALREAGGSLEEVGSAKEAPPRDVPRAEPVATPVAPALKVEDATPVPAASSVKTKAEPPREKTKAEKSVIVNARPREEVTQPAVRRGSVAPAPRTSEPPPRVARSAAVQEAAGAAADSGGGGRLVLALIAVAAVVGVVIFLNKSDEPAPEPPPAAEQPAAVEAPPEPAPQVAEPAPAPLPQPSAAASAAASAEPATSALLPGNAVAPAPSAPVPSAPAPEPAVAKPPPAPRPRPPQKPTPAAPATDPAPAETPPAEAAPPKPAEAPAPKPAEAAPPKPAEAPAPKPKPAPAPKAPKPAEPPGDNPY